MKKICVIVCIAMITLVFSVQVNAALETLGTDILGNRLIYDSDLDITWYDYSNSADSWENQLNWAQDLTVDFDGNIIDDWRLPVTYDQDHRGYSYTNSELGHLFYTELGNLGHYDTAGNPQSGWGLNNTGDFQTLVRNAYWSGTEYTANTIHAWYLYFNGGNHNYNYKSDLKYALAVRPGNIAVMPEPLSMILFGTGGVILAARRKILRRRNR